MLSEPAEQLALREHLPPLALVPLRELQERLVHGELLAQTQLQEHLVKLARLETVGLVPCLELTAQKGLQELQEQRALAEQMVSLVQTERLDKAEQVVEQTELLAPTELQPLQVPLVHRVLMELRVYLVVLLVRQALLALAELREQQLLAVPLEQVREQAVPLALQVLQVLPQQRVHLVLLELLV